MSNEQRLCPALLRVDRRGETLVLFGELWGEWVSRLTEEPTPEAPLTGLGRQRPPVGMQKRARVRQ